MTSIGPYWVGDVPATDLEVEVTRNGQPADLGDFTGATVMLIGPDGTSMTLTATIQDFAIIIDWPQVSPFGVSGGYTVLPILTGEQNVREVVDPIPLLVNDIPVFNDWLTTTGVFEITRQEVSEADIASATSVLSLITGRDLSDMSIYKASDARMVRMAVAWQAVHMKTNPAVMISVATTSSAVGDVSVSYDTAAGAQWLSPLARVALRKLSWRKGNRTVRVGRLVDRVPVNGLIEDQDPEYGWTPLRTGV